MDIKYLNDNELIPNVLFCNNFIEGMSLPINHKLDSRYIYDYELEIITDCQKGYMIQNGVKVIPKKGDIIFRRPGETTQGIMRYSSYIFCFEHSKSNRIFEDGYDLMKPKNYFQPQVKHPLIDNIPSIFHTNQYNRFLNFFKEILNCFINPHVGSEAYMGSLVIQILYHLNQEINQVIDHSHSKSDDIKYIISYIEANLDKDLSLEVLSKQVHLSPTYFHQVFTKIVGKTPQNFVMEKRINMAKELLVHTSSSVKEITYLTGFKDTSYFCYAFKRETTFTPIQYREAHQLSYI